jgi:hypothetical protein
MRRRSILPVFVFLALLLSGCAGNPSYDPWLVPRDSFLARTRAIALSPIQVPEDLEEPEPVEAMFDSLIANALRAAGFSVVASDIVLEIWNHGADSIGGYYDPMTGRPDTSKLNPLRRYFRQRLRDEHGAQAVLLPEIVVVDASYADGEASWDGTSQAVAGFFAILLSAIANSQMPAGAAEGFSLDVQIESVDGGVVYTNRGGIELWAKPSGDGSRLNWVPRERLFADRKRCEKAVRIALEPVLKREGSVAR